jgi:hypothetical protein
MENFAWITAAGPLIANPVPVGGIVSAGLEATPNAMPYFSVIVGSLPDGLSLINQDNHRGLIFGRVRNNYNITTSTFVIRAYSLLFNNSIDRTFSITVSPIGAPIWPYGEYLSGPNVDKTFNDFEYVNLQLTAFPPPDAPSAYNITYSLTTDSGRLPAGLTLSNSGMLSGIISIPITSIISAKVSYGFTVLASNGYSSTPQSCVMTVDCATTSGPAPVFLGDPNLGIYRANSNQIISISFYNPIPSFGSITYEKNSGSLPPGMNLDTTSGFIYGVIPPQQNYLTTYNFGIKATKYNAFSEFTNITNQNFNISIIKDNFDTISWATTATLGTMHAQVPSTFKVIATHTETMYGLSYFSVGNNFPDGLILDPTGDILGATTSTGTFAVTIVATTGTAYDTQSWNNLENAKNYPVAFALKTFNFNVVADPLQYTNIYVRPFLSVSQRLAYQQFTKNTDIFEDQYLYRPEDPNFGVNLEFKIYVQYGIQQLLSFADYQGVFLNNPIANQEKILYIDSVASVAAAMDPAGAPLYDVVYMKVQDYNRGRLFLDSIQTRFASLLNYQINTNPAFLPSWQTVSGSTFIYGVVLCYAIPGKGSLIVNNLKQYAQTLDHFNFSKINFTMDRLVIEQTLTSTSSSYLMLP